MLIPLFSHAITVPRTNRMAKRPADEQLPTEEAPPAKKQRAYAPVPVYVVSVTHFKDSYKARGNDWSESRTLGMYRSERRAKKREEAEIKSIVTEYLKERDGNSDLEEYWQFTSDDEDADSKDDDSAERVLNMKRVRRDLCELEDRASEGEFVPNKFSVDIESVLFDDRASDEESVSG